MTDSDLLSKRDFLDFALERFEFEYAELIDVWKQVDSKAQATTTICGVLLAAIFAFVRTFPSPAPLSLKVLIALSVALAMGTIVMAIQVHLLRQTYIPASGAQTAQIIEHVFSMPPEELQRRYEALLGDAINDWSSVNKQLRAELQIKTRRLHRAHMGLLSCAVSVALTTILTLIRY